MKLWYNIFYKLNVMENIMKILHNPQFNTEKVTEHYTKKDGVPVRYVCTTDLDESDKPIDIYYRDTPHPDFGNYYFGLFADGDRMMICKADTVEKYNFGLLGKEDSDEWVYSQSHHDFVETDSGYIDGGRVYIKRGGEDLDNQKHVVAKVVDGEFITEEV